MLACRCPLTAAATLSRLLLLMGFVSPFKIGRPVLKVAQIAFLCAAGAAAASINH